jgi:hypothetical protein
VQPTPDPGSFRDPRSRVFLADDGVYRGLSHEGLADWESVEAAPFFRSLVDERKVVATERVEGPPEIDGDWAAFLRHERVPLISYPYEWTFAMLRDAALLQIEVTRRALADGCITKDATAYNVQFDGTRPVFIDVGSFEPVQAGEPWPGYRQFCEHFLNPLVLQSVAGVPFQPWLRGSIRGIAPADVAPLIRGRHRLDRRLLVHVRMHARAQRRYDDRDPGDVRRELQQAGFGPKIVDAQLRNLGAAVESLAWKGDESTWSGYSERSHYDDADLTAKTELVERSVREVAPRVVLDLGANDGRFSSVALDAGASRVVAVDSDALVVDRLYQHLRRSGEERITPLLLDLADPSPGAGWRSRERPGFFDRVRPDLVLCLAVVHHLALTDTVPFPGIVELLADLDAPLVVEFPHRDDPMVTRLLARKRTGLFDHYDQPQWVEALGARFTIDEKVALPSGRRTLYRCRPR